MNISKDDIANELSKELDLKQSFSKLFVSSFINIIKKNLLYSDVKIHNFGSFKKKLSPERIGRNPKTKEEHIIKSRKKVSFKASKKIIQIIN